MTPELKYYSYTAKDITLYLNGVKISILKLSPKLVEQSTHIELDYNDTFLKIVYRRKIERKDWTPKIETFHVELIPIKNISKIDVDIEKEF